VDAGSADNCHSPLLVSRTAARIVCAEEELAEPTTNVVSAAEERSRVDGKVPLPSSQHCPSSQTHRVGCGAMESEVASDVTSDGAKAGGQRTPKATEPAGRVRSARKGGPIAPDVRRGESVCGESGINIHQHIPFLPNNHNNTLFPAFRSCGRWKDGDGGCGEAGDGECVGAG
jgi:hypothetical protein